MDNLLQTVLYVAFTSVVMSYQQSLADTPPDFRREPTSQVVDRGSTVKLKCSFDPKEADVRWTFNGLFITSENSLGIEISKTYLFIDNFEDRGPLSNVGEYQCIVSTRVGTIISRRARLQVPYIKPFSTRLPTEVMAPVMGDAIIPCETPDSLPPAGMTYTKDGRSIQTNSGHFRILPSGHLHITNVSVEDAGTYTCQAENPVSNQRVQSQTAISFNVAKEFFQADSKPSILYSIGNTVHRGTMAILECAAIGKPVPIVRWRLDGGDVPAGAYQHGGSLIIPEVSIRDGGTYECEADNGVGKPATEEVTLTVIKPPSIKKSPKDAIVNPGDTGKFKCIVGRATDNDITWYFNGKNLSNSNKYTLNGGELIVRDVTLSDLGMYQCFVETTEGTSQAIAQMRLTDGYPSIVQPPQNTTAIEAETVSLTCTIDGDPMPYVGWTNPRGEKIMNIENKISISEDLAGWLRIKGVSKEHVGWYTCIAANKHGRVQARAYLDVIALRDPITATTSPAIITQQVLDPPGKLPGTRVSDGTLEHTEVQLPSGKQGPAPKKPSKPQLFKTSETSVVVTWNHTQSSTDVLSGYVVKYKEILSEEWHIASNSIGPDSRSFEVKNLDEETIYRFIVIATNEDGASSESEMSNRFLLKVTPVITPPPPRHVPSSPRISMCEAKSPFSIVVQWTYEPTSPQIPVDGFYIFTRLTDSDDDRDYVRNPVLGGDIREYVITKLEPEESYDIKMTTFISYRNHEVEESRYSNVVIVTTPAKPTDPAPVKVPKPQTAQPVTTIAPAAKVVNVLHIWLGVVLGAMLLVMIMLVALCFWKSNRRQVGKNIRYIPPELHQSVYGGGAYHFVKPDGSITPYHQVNGYAKHPGSPKHSSSHLAWPDTTRIYEPRPLYTMPQDALNGPVVLPYQTVPSGSIHLYTPVGSPNGDIALPNCASYEHVNGHPPMMNGSVPSLRSMSHSSLGPRPVCYIKRCKIPEQVENGCPPVMYREGSDRKLTFSGDESKGGTSSPNLSCKVGSNGNFMASPSTSPRLPTTSSQPEDDKASDCSRPRSLSNQSNTSSHHSNVQSDSSHGTHQSHPTSIHSSSSIITDV